MAKKKPVALEAPDKARVELRFDTALNDRIRELADKVSISVNQLIQGVMRWAVENAVVGENYREANGHVRVRPVPGCVFFGTTTTYWEPGERQEWEEHLNKKLPAEYRDEGKIIFALDFTERHVVRDAEEGPPAKREKNTKKPSRREKE